MARDDVLAFWFGEPDEVTPAFIRQARHRCAQRRRDVLHAQPRHCRVARGDRALRRAPASTDRRRSDRGHEFGHVGADARPRRRWSAPGDRVVAVTPLWPNLVEIPKILGADVECVALRFGRDRLDARPRSAARRAHARHARRLHQFAEQSHRLDARRARRSARSSRIAAGTASGSSPTMRTSGSTSTGARRRVRAVVPRSRRSRRSRRQHEHVLEVVADDRMAARLDRRAAALVPRSREAPRVQHVVRAAVRPARRASSRSTRRRAGDRAYAWAAFAARAISCDAHLRRMPGIEARRAAGRDVRVLPRRRTSPTASSSASGSCAEAGLGLAPGIAFGPEGEGFVRWCFASSESRLADGVGRLQDFSRRATARRRPSSPRRSGRRPCRSSARRMSCRAASALAAIAERREHLLRLGFVSHGQARARSPGSSGLPLAIAVGREHRRIADLQAHVHDLVLGVGREHARRRLLRDCPCCASASSLRRRACCCRTRPPLRSGLRRTR